MPSREEIREHLVELFEQTDFSKETPEQLADVVLWVENEDGVVIKVDRELPKLSFGQMIYMEASEWELNEVVRREVGKAGYVAVESLIK